MMVAVEGLTNRTVDRDHSLQLFRPNFIWQEIWKSGRRPARTPGRCEWIWGKPLRVPGSDLDGGGAGLGRPSSKRSRRLETRAAHLGLE